MRDDIRWVQRLDSLSRALEQLGEAVELAKSRALSQLEQQGLIQAFEFTHELAWNTLKDFFAERGNNAIFGSKDATREAFQYGLILDGDAWMRMIASRNLSSHTYNRSTADQIAREVIDTYYGEFERLRARLESMKDDDSP